MKCGKFIFSLAYIAGLHLITPVAYSQEEGDPLRKKSYPIAEIDYAGPDTTQLPYQALKALYFRRLLVESESAEIQSLGHALVGISREIARAQNESEKWANKDSVEERAFLAFLKSRYDPFQDWEWRLQAIAEESQADFTRLQSEVLRIISRSETLAFDVWHLRASLLEEAEQRQSNIRSKILNQNPQLSGERLEALVETEFLKITDGDQIFIEDASGKAELTLIDGRPVPRVVLNARRESITLPYSSDVHVRSYQGSRYTASQHLNAGRSGDGSERGRDELRCRVLLGEDGKETIEDVRYFPRPPKGSIEDHKDNILYLGALTHKKSIFSDKDLMAKVQLGFEAGIKQAAIFTVFIDLPLRAIHIMTSDSEAHGFRPFLFAFTIGFSSLCGLLQTQLKNFTSHENRYLHPFERILRKLVTTSLPFNLVATIASHGIYSLDLATLSGVASWGLLAITVYISTMIKDARERVIDVDSDLRLNKSPDIKYIPSRSILGHPLSDEPVPVLIAPKKSESDRRQASLENSSIRILDITGVNVPVSSGLSFPIAKVASFLTMFYKEWEAVRYAEAKAHYNGPIWRARWEAPLRTPEISLGSISIPSVVLLPKRWKSAVGLAAIPIGYVVDRAVVGAVDFTNWSYDQIKYRSLTGLNRVFYRDRKDESGLPILNSNGYPLREPRFSCSRLIRGLRGDKGVVETPPNLPRPKETELIQK